MGRRNQTQEEGPASRIVSGLFKLALVIRHQGWKAAGESGLTPTQSQILAFLANGSRETGVKTVAQQLSITMGTASEAVSALERKGLLAKASSPSDGRAVVLSLTRRGRKEGKRCREWPEVLVQAAHTLPEAEQAGFLRGLIGMIRTLQEQGEVPTARMCVNCLYFRPNVAPGSEKQHYCGYMDAAISDVDLCIDCDDMEAAPEDLRPRLMEALVAGTSVDEPRDGTDQKPFTS